MKLIRRLATGIATVCLLASLTFSAHSEENRRVRIINRASSSIRYLYASNVDRRTWEEDLLGPFAVLLPDHYVDVNIDDGTGHCRYDLRAVLSDGREAVTSNFNVCAEPSWTVTDGN
ncbi:MAG TPA: hypothetical protein VHZ07_12595 [Bryobacteraceae bacterium]|jgi:hypothetical protein|nr:hypothetical protein [Bryobacteraceae bacterium]